MTWYILVSDFKIWIKFLIILKDFWWFLVTLHPCHIDGLWSSWIMKCEDVIKTRTKVRETKHQGQHTRYMVIFWDVKINWYTIGSLRPNMKHVALYRFTKVKYVKIIQNMIRNQSSLLLVHVIGSDLISCIQFRNYS